MYRMQYFQFMKTWHKQLIVAVLLLLVGVLTYRMITERWGAFAGGVLPALSLLFGKWAYESRKQDS